MEPEVASHNFPRKTILRDTFSSTSSRTLSSSRVINALLRRLTTPSFYKQCTKAQLCLSMSAAARLTRLYIDEAPEIHVNSSMQQQLSSVTSFAAEFDQRMREMAHYVRSNILPFCTARECGMIGAGMCGAFGVRSAAFTEALLAQCHSSHYSVSPQTVQFLNELRSSSSTRNTKEINCIDFETCAELLLQIAGTVTAEGSAATWCWERVLELATTSAPAINLNSAKNLASLSKLFLLSTTRVAPEEAVTVKLAELIIPRVAMINSLSTLQDVVIGLGFLRAAVNQNDTQSHTSYPLSELTSIVTDRVAAEWNRVAYKHERKKALVLLLNVVLETSVVNLDTGAYDTIYDAIRTDTASHLLVGLLAMRKVVLMKRLTSADDSSDMTSSSVTQTIALIEPMQLSRCPLLYRASMHLMSALIEAAGEDQSEESLFEYYASSGVKELIEMWNKTPAWILPLGDWHALKRAAVMRPEWFPEAMGLFDSCAASDTPLTLGSVEQGECGQNSLDLSQSTAENVTFTLLSPETHFNNDGSVLGAIASSIILAASVSSENDLRVIMSLIEISSAAMQQLQLPAGSDAHSTINPVKAAVIMHTRGLQHIYSTSVSQSSALMHQAGISVAVALEHYVKKGTLQDPAAVEILSGVAKNIVMATDADDFGEEDVKVAARLHLLIPAIPRYTDVRTVLQQYAALSDSDEKHNEVDTHRESSNAALVKIPDVQRLLKIAEDGKKRDVELEQSVLIQFADGLLDPTAIAAMTLALCLLRHPPGPVFDTVAREISPETMPITGVAQILRGAHIHPRVRSHLYQAACSAFASILSRSPASWLDAVKALRGTPIPPTGGLLELCVAAVITGSGFLPGGGLIQQLSIADACIILSSLANSLPSDSSRLISSSSQKRRSHNNRSTRAGENVEHLKRSVAKVAVETFTQRIDVMTAKEVSMCLDALSRFDYHDHDFVGQLHNRMASFNLVDESSDAGRNPKSYGLSPSDALIVLQAHQRLCLPQHWRVANHLRDYCIRQVDRETGSLSHLTMPSLLGVVHSPAHVDTVLLSLADGILDQLRAANLAAVAKALSDLYHSDTASALVVPLIERAAALVREQNTTPNDEGNPESDELVDTEIDGELGSLQVQSNRLTAGDIVEVLRCSNVHINRLYTGGSGGTLPFDATVLIEWLLGTVGEDLTSLDVCVIVRHMGLFGNCAHRPDLVEAAVVRFALLCDRDGLPTADFAECVCDLAHLNAPPLEDWITIADAAVDNSDRWRNATHIVRLLHGFSRLAIVHRPLYNVFPTRLQVRPILSSLQPHEVSVVMHAFADVKYLDEALFTALSRQACREADSYGAVEVALTVHAQSKLYLLNPDLYQQLADRALMIPEQFSDPDIALMMLNGLGESKTKRPDVISKILDVLDLEQLGPHGCVQLLIECCNNCYCGPHLPTVTDYLYDNLPALTGEEVADVAECFQHMGWLDSRMLIGLASRACRLHTAGELTPRDARLMMDVLASFNIDHRESRALLSETAKSVILKAPLVDPVEAAAEQQALGT